jgi:hypothetical protein
VQFALRDSTARFNVVPAGRRSGKTENGKRIVIEKAIAESVEMKWDDYRYFMGAPTRDQAKRIFWNDLKKFTDGMRLKEPRESDLCVTLLTGAEIWVIGLDKPQRIEGSPWNGGLLDEYGNMKPQAWPENIRPALSDREGWCIFTGVPEGRNHYFDLANKGWKDEEDWATFTWKSADILPAKEIESAKRDLDPLTFQQEYEASFINFEGRVYYPFLEATHCAPLLYDPNQPLIFAFDFNVAPGTASILQEQCFPNGKTGTGVIGEVHIPRNSNTPAVCRKLLADWGNHQGKVYCYGDATGGAQGSAKVDGSDWDLIRKILKPTYGDRLFIRVSSANPPEKSRVNAVNARLLNTSEEIRLMVDPRKAPNVVRDFEGVTLLKGGSGEIDKLATPELTHLTDGIGYYIVYEFPVSSPKGYVGNARP